MKGVDYVANENNNVENLEEETNSTELETPDVPNEPDEPIEPEPETNPHYYATIKNFYDRVRSSLSSNGNHISNEVIDYPENAPMSEMLIMNRVPNWEDLEGFKKDLFDTCIVYMTCAMLCAVAYSTSVTEQTTPSLTLKYSSNIKDKPCQRFFDLVDDLIAQINDTQITNFLGFKVTKASRNCCRRNYWG